MQERESKMQNASAGAEKKGLFTKPTKRQAVLFARRVVAYVLGMFLIACGVSMSRSTNWGISPVNSIPNVLSLALPEISMGLWVIIVFACFILVQLAILGRQFKWYYIFQLVSSTLFGFLVDGTNALFGLFLPAEQAVWLKILLIAASTVVIACGIFLYLEGGLINMPGEGVTVALSKRTGLKVSTCKIIFDVSVVLIACILSLIFFRGSDVFWTLVLDAGRHRGHAARRRHRHGGHRRVRGGGDEADHSLFQTAAAPLFIWGRARRARLARCACSARGARRAVADGGKGTCGPAGGSRPGGRIERKFFG